MWITEFSGESTAPPATVYRLLASPTTWHEWNPGVQRIEMDGPFAAGTSAVMVLPDGTALPFRFTWVEPDVGFEDETPVPDTGVVVRVRHELSASGTGTRITYRCEADGPADVAATVGAQVSSDFPDVIAALAAHAHSG
jgi:uncharacterized protein YndB with AHSA1/START domain